MSRELIEKHPLCSFMFTKACNCRILIIFLLTICFSHDAYAQFEPTPLSSRGHAMGGLSAAFADFGGGKVNPSALGWVNNYNIEIDWRQLFAMKGFAYKSIAAGVPTGKVGSAAIYYTHFGDKAYNEQCASLHYGLKVAKGVSVGAAIYFMHCGTNDGHYDSFNSATGSVGVQYKPVEKLIFGVSIFNLTTAFLCNSTSVPPTRP